MAALDSKTALSRARACIRIEIDALEATAKSLSEDFVDVVHAVEETASKGGKVILTGVGKSAHVAQKLVGTFNSTGVSSCFLDATQALHGDLGLCAEGDLAIALSNSGQSDEILRLVPVLKRFGVRIVALTSRPESDLAKHAEFRLVYKVPREACPLKLAPTASTTAALALGDALAMVLRGNNLTDAAHTANFADSAHFSRTVRSMFGIQARALHNLQPQLVD